MAVNEGLSAEKPNAKVYQRYLSKESKS